MPSYTSRSSLSRHAGLSDSSSYFNRPPRHGSTLTPTHEHSMFDVGQRLVHIAETHHGVVIDHHHAAVVGRGRYLEDMRRHFATKGFADLVHFESQLAFSVDP